MERSEHFIKLVCDYSGVSIVAAKSKRRYRKLCDARKLISYTLRRHTKMSFNEMAEVLKYKSHASSIRDVSQVENFLEVDILFASRFNPLLRKAAELATKLDRQERKEIQAEPIEAGDLCWFWNVNMPFPVLRTYSHSIINENSEMRYMPGEDVRFAYSHCIYAGEFVVPDSFHLSKEVSTDSDTKNEIHTPALL